VGARLQYVSRVEQGRGCNRAVARKMADALGVDLDELRAESGGAEVAGTRYLHKAYLKLLLERVVGSAYAVLAEDELLLQVRLFLEELVRERPAEDIRILAAARTQEPSEEGRERLTRAMRELL
jgi:hypothetical protein